MNKNNPKNTNARNNSIVDIWSFIHIASSAGLAYLIGPIPALIAVTLWEPFEIFVLSPALGHFNILFGHESLRNSMSDLAFNILGVLLAIPLLD